MSLRKRALASILTAAAVASVVTTSESPADAQARLARFDGRNAFGVACTSMDAAKTFCAAACDGPSCPRSRIPTGDGLMASESSELQSLPKMKYVSAGSSVRATKDVVDALKRLDTWLEQSPDRAKYGYTVRVENCWRDGIYDIQKECYFVQKGKNPQHLGLALPGASPHSGGKACDIVLVDAKGKTATSCSANDEKKLGAGLDYRTASRLLDEALTNDSVGARRLAYEAWHYEWGGPTGCRCKAPDCANDFWPPLCGADQGASCSKKSGR